MSKVLGLNEFWSIMYTKIAPVYIILNSSFSFQDKARNAGCPKCSRQVKIRVACKESDYGKLSVYIQAFLLFSLQRT